MNSMHPHADGRLLLSALEKAGKSFAPDELAYLALTSKPELAIRDRLAWVLHSELPDHTAAREWSPPGAGGRSDFALLDAGGTVPHLILELKAAYTFDFTEPQQGTVAKYMGYIADDLAKARAAADHHPADVYALLLLTHPDQAPVGRPGVVKYGAPIRRALTRTTGQELRAAARSVVEPRLRGFGPIGAGSIDAGRAFDIHVDLDYWLIGPAPKAQ